MWIDVIDLRAFYATALGRLARRLITRRLRDLWPDLRGRRVLGLGYATPYLASFRDDAERVLAAMPVGQGVTRWPDPESGPGPSPVAGLVCLTEECALPFPDRSIDRLLLVHCLESTPEPRQLMRECWRVLAGGGRLLVVVANRRGLWARAEHSPFAHGRPYSESQIAGLLRDGLFAPLQSAPALFLPPVWWRLFGAWAAALERVGARWFPTFAGVIAVEAEKQIYAVPWDAASVRVRGLATAGRRIRPIGASERTPLAR